jgi:hypothetical protein
VQDLRYTPLAGETVAALVEPAGSGAAQRSRRWARWLVEDGGEGRSGGGGLRREWIRIRPLGDGDKGRRRGNKKREK